MPSTAADILLKRFTCTRMNLLPIPDSSWYHTKPSLAFTMYGPIKGFTFLSQIYFLCTEHNVTQSPNSYYSPLEFLSYCTFNIRRETFARPINCLYSNARRVVKLEGFIANKIKVYASPRFKGVNPKNCLVWRHFRGSTFLNVVTVAS